ncbi:MAG: hypothetical protein WCV84_04020 [Patescibacteria group bacterium]
MKNTASNQPAKPPVAPPPAEPPREIRPEDSPLFLAVAAKVIEQILGPRPRRD